MVLYWKNGIMIWIMFMLCYVLFCAKPQTELAKFINAYKSAGSRLIKKDHPKIREKLWKDAFRSRSYCLLTTVGATVDVIRRGILRPREMRTADEKRADEKISGKAAGRSFDMWFMTEFDFSVHSDTGAEGGRKGG